MNRACASTGERRVHEVGLAAEDAVDVERGLGPGALVEPSAACGSARRIGLVEDRPRPSAGPGSRLLLAPSAARSLRAAAPADAVAREQRSRGPASARGSHSAPRRRSMPECMSRSPVRIVTWNPTSPRVASVNSGCSGRGGSPSKMTQTSAPRSSCSRKSTIGGRRSPPRRRWRSGCSLGAHPPREQLGRLEERVEGALVVRDPAPVEPAVALRQLERRPTPRARAAPEAGRRNGHRRGSSAHPCRCSRGCRRGRGRAPEGRGPPPHPRRRLTKSRSHSAARRTSSRCVGSALIDGIAMNSRSSSSQAWSTARNSTSRRVSARHLASAWHFSYEALAGFRRRRRGASRHPRGRAASSGSDSRSAGSARA